jgi:hypothetical protein
MTTLAIEPGTGAAPDPDVLSAELAAQLRADFDQGKGCQHCGGRHARACPRVKRFKFHPNGTLAQVDFWPEGEWSDDHVIWPEDLT